MHTNEPLMIRRPTPRSRYRLTILIIGSLLVILGLVSTRGGGPRLSSYSSGSHNHNNANNGGSSRAGVGLRVAVYEGSGFHDGKSPSSFPGKKTQSILTLFVPPTKRTRTRPGDRRSRILDLQCRALRSERYELPNPQVHVPSVVTFRRIAIRSALLIEPTNHPSMLSPKHPTDLRVSPDYPGGWRFGFARILSPFHPGPTISTPPKGVDSLESSLGRGEVDVILIASCDQRWLEKSLVHVLSQPSSVQVICLHHEENGFQAHHGPFSSLAHDGRLQYVSLGTHTSRMYARYLVKWALSDREPGWAKWPVQTLIARLPIPAHMLPSPQTAREKQKRPVYNDVVIMGDLTGGRRHFDRVFAELESEIKADPAAWGYTYNSSTERLVALDPSTAFKLHILGSDKGTVKVPPLLTSAGVLQIHAGTSYEEYYSILGRMDLVVPAWLDDEYWAKRASASISAAINAKVPTLLYRAVIDAYPYLQPIAYVLQLAGESEIATIRRLRSTPGTRQDSYEALGREELEPFWTSNMDEISDWDQYHQLLDRWNSDVLDQALLRARRGSEADSRVR